jgi:superfamily II DNA/RNA helicase
MDIGDVEVVVQYKATCDLNTLWQRFGRAARDAGTRGVGILLVEKKDTVTWRKGASHGPKRNSRDSQTGRRTRQKRSTYPQACQIPMDVDTTCQPTRSSGLSLPDLATWSHERQIKYARPEIARHDPTNAKKGRAPGVQPGTAMDDFINLPSYVPCRRLVPQIYFCNAI